MDEKLVEAVRITETRECPMTGDVTVYLSNGRAWTFDRRDFQKNALQAWAESMQLLPTNERVDVIQYGRKVGEMPAFWSPALAKSTSFLYDYRRGDLTLIDGKWHAARGLGASDLDCLVGFVRKNTENSDG